MCSASASFFCVPPTARNPSTTSRNAAAYAAAAAGTSPDTPISAPLLPCERRL
ncbi:hypothetical protein SMICM17S_10103 [Streptomyces microflavus]